mgnify:FL=1
MQDIATRVGVTRATVSNVLSGKHAPERPYARERAELIRRVAREIGYRPSVAARATRTGRTGFIGMIRSPSLMCSVHVAAFDHGLDEALHERGLCLVRDTIDDDASTAPRIVRESAVDGLIINYAFGTPPHIREMLDASRIPAVWVNRKRDRNCVYPDDEGASAEATRAMLGRGHRRVAMLGTVPRRSKRATEPHTSTADRHRGYERVMRAAGLAPRFEPLRMPEDLAAVKSGWLLRACVAFLRRTDRPTAVLCNFNGRTMLHAAEIARLRVPEDLSVMAFDDEAGADERTAVDRLLVPHLPMGRAVVAETCALVDDPASPREPVVLPFEFHRTGTVGRPGEPQ